MEASARLLLSPAALHRGLRLRHHIPPPLSRWNRNFLSLRPVFRASHPSNNRSHHFACSASNPLASLFSSLSRPTPPFDPADVSLVWDSTPAATAGSGGRLPAIGDGDSEEWLVVVLGWLGAEVKHLRRYAEMYGSRGARTVRFVVRVKEFFGPDLGRRIEDRVSRLAGELADWCDEKQREGKQLRLLFHTFSNTGWLCYGVILQHLQKRSDILEKIKGCIFDSGPAAEIDPQHWAAGFGAALLRKQNPAMTNSIETLKDDKPIATEASMREIKAPLNEFLFLFMLEKFFAVVLKLPDINRRLNGIISTLSDNQPSCPQLYLYSSADDVVPARSVGSFIQNQKARGIYVLSHDFETSPHVDHLRAYPDIYKSKVYEFWKACCSQAICKA